MTTTTNKLTAQDVARRTSLRLYDDCGHSHYADHAEEQLRGRSLYYDGSTRRGFGCRVLDCRASHDGLLLVAITSDGHPSDGRIFRAVVHDLAGTVVYRSCDDDDTRTGFKSSAAAGRDLERFLASYHDAETEAARVLDAQIHAAERHLRQLHGE